MKNDGSIGDATESYIKGRVRIAIGLIVVFTIINIVFRTFAFIYHTIINFIN